MPSRAVLDIETAGTPFDDLDHAMQEYLLRFARDGGDAEQEKLKVNLYPYTAEIVCIGMMNVETCRAHVLVRASGALAPWRSADGRAEFTPCDERGMLETFWDEIAAFDQVVTFNGRNFDAPFLHIRSAMLGIPASRSLMPPRYAAGAHYDLLEHLTFHGAFRRFSLDCICKAFGIDSPKAHGVTGHDVNALHRAGRTREIAEYNLRDLIATRELYLRWIGHMGA